jgi:hypothetical protein
VLVQELLHDSQRTQAFRFGIPGRRLGQEVRVPALQHRSRGKLRGMEGLRAREQPPGGHLLPEERLQGGSFSWRRDAPGLESPGEDDGHEQSRGVEE